jgi:hypothetical protein
MLLRITHQIQEGRHRRGGAFTGPNSGKCNIANQHDITRSVPFFLFGVHDDNSSTNANVFQFSRMVGIRICPVLNKFGSSASTPRFSSSLLREVV